MVKTVWWIITMRLVDAMCDTITDEDKCTLEDTDYVEVTLKNLITAQVNRSFGLDMGKRNLVRRQSADMGSQKKRRVDDDMMHDSHTMPGTSQKDQYDSDGSDVKRSPSEYILSEKQSLENLGGSPYSCVTTSSLPSASYSQSDSISHVSVMEVVDTLLGMKSRNFPAIYLDKYFCSKPDTTTKLSAISPGGEEISYEPDSSCQVLDMDTGERKTSIVSDRKEASKIDAASDVSNKALTSHACHVDRVTSNTAEVMETIISSEQSPSPASVDMGNAQNISHTPSMCLYRNISIPPKKAWGRCSSSTAVSHLSVMKSTNNIYPDADVASTSTAPLSSHVYVSPAQHIVGMRHQTPRHEAVSKSTIILDSTVSDVHSKEKTPSTNAQQNLCEPILSEQNSSENITEQNKGTDHLKKDNHSHSKMQERQPVIHLCSSTQDMPVANQQDNVLTLPANSQSTPAAPDDHLEMRRIVAGGNVEQSTSHNDLPYEDMEQRELADGSKVRVQPMTQLKPSDVMAAVIEKMLSR